MKRAQLSAYILINSFADGKIVENKNNWELLSYNTSENLAITNSASANTIEFALSTPIALHAFEVLPLLTSNINKN